MTKRSLPKQDHPRQHFRFHRLNPALRKRIQPWGPRWQGHTLDTRVIEHLLACRTELCVAVMDEILAWLNPTATLLEHALLTQGFMGGSKAGFLHILQPQNRDSTRANLATHKSDVVGLERGQSL